MCTFFKPSTESCKNEAFLVDTLSEGQRNLFYGVRLCPRRPRKVFATLPFHTAPAGSTSSHSKLLDTYPVEVRGGVFPRVLVRRRAAAFEDLSTATCATITLLSLQ